jgi:hypothetical protein
MTFKDNQKWCPMVNKKACLIKKILKKYLIMFKCNIWQVESTPINMIHKSLTIGNDI